MNFKKYHVSRNLFDAETVTAGRAINDDTGGIIPSANYNASDYIDISEFAKISILDTQTNRWGAFYDGSKVCISGFNGYGTITVPQNAVYVRVTVPNNYLSTFMLNGGDTLLPYEPYSSEVWHDTPHYIMGTDTDTITTLPAVVYANDNNATVGLKGNMQQNGTPTPTTPIQPQECGEKAENLFDYNAYFDSVFTPYNEYFNYAEIQLQPNTTYTLSTSIEEIGYNPRNTAFIVATSNETPTTASGGISNVSPITKTTESDGILKLYKRISGNGVMPTKDLFDAGDWLMLNAGSTALPYEPYGIKIPILSANTTTNVYLGETQSTRNIKKKVFDGTESIDLYEGKFYIKILDGMSTIIAPYSSHYIGYNGATSGMPINAVKQIAVRLWGETPIPALIFYNEYTSIADFKTFLQQQYSAGTPVCVWYVLATPTTGIVNEPLRKIGTYADEVSGITIPTIAGENTLSIGTTLQPSEVTVNYKGWHPVADVHERESGQWD